MKAQVTHFNSKIGYYSAVTEQKEKIVFRVVGSSTIKLNDMLEGASGVVGSHTVINTTAGTQVRIEIKEIHKINAPFQGHSGQKIKPF